MSKKQETIDDILEEMRNKGWEKCQLGWDENRALFLELAYRIEAAWKRERVEVRETASTTILKERVPVAVGNAAAMREAVVLALSLLDLKDGVPYKTVSQKDIDFMKAALAEPSRNCDLYNDVEDSWQDYKQFRRQIGEAIYFDMVHFWPFAKWLFATATEHKGEVDTTKARRHDERR